MQDTPDTPPMVEIQNLTRDCHEALVLALLSSQPRHGYQLALELAEKSGGSFRFKHGTLYPILHRLEHEGLIEGRWSAKTGKRQRKSYSLTHKGRQRLAQEVQAWAAFVTSFSLVLEEVER